MTLEYLTITQTPGQTTISFPLLAYVRVLLVSIEGFFPVKVNGDPASGQYSHDASSGQLKFPDSPDNFQQRKINVLYKY